MSVHIRSVAKVWLLNIFISIICHPCSGQTNLLLNGNFEEMNTCAEFNAECGVEAWFYLKDIKMQMVPNESNGGPESNNTFAIFYNWTGYTGFTPIIGTILPCTLQKGKQYVFKGWIIAKLNSKLLFKPGICTGEKFYVPKRPFALEMKPDSILRIKRIPEKAFYEFEYQFTANGNERYLTFGSFVKEDSIGPKKISFAAQPVSIVLDNFSLTPLDSAETFCPAFKQNKFRIYGYNFRHKDMDYTLYGKGRLPINLDESDSANLTQIETAFPPPVVSDTLKLGDVLFDFNKAELQPTANQLLNAYFKNDKDSRKIDSVYIEGHTDSIGTDARNMQLSQQRCEAVQQWMITNNIVAVGSIQINPFGRTRPITTNKTPQGRALNRRVEVVVFRKRL